MDPQNPIKPKKVETYTEDMARVLEDDKSGLIKKIIHEQERHEEERKNFSPESRKNKVEMLVSLVLVLASFAILFVSIAKKDALLEPVEERFAPLVFLDKNFYIDVSGLGRNEIIGSVRSEMENTDLSPGEVEGIFFTENKKIIGLRRTLGLLEAKLLLPEEALFADRFLTGIAKGGTEDFFILIKVRSLQDAFEPLRAWEGKMFADMSSIFGLKMTEFLMEAPFEDGVIENKNARILKDEEGETALMYVFLNDTSVIITRTSEAVREISLRLYSAASSSI